MNNNFAIYNDDKAYLPRCGAEELHAVTGDGEYAVLPCFCDVHVHFREPGFSYKETIRTGSLAAARGGYSAVCTMPNLNPVPDSTEHIKIQQDIIDAQSVIRIYPYASITVGQKGQKLSDMEALADKCIAFSDDGKGIQSEEMMREAMKIAKSLNKMIVAHCETESMLNGGYIHEGDYAKEHNHRGISSESEYSMIERDLKLAKEIGCRYHVCHISAKESVDLIRRAKIDGVDVSCETAPHYLILTENDLHEDGKFKMNPPLRSKEDRQALTEGILDGTIDMIATDHAPHSAEEKSRGLEKSTFGIVGLETAFPLMYTSFVKTGIMPLEKLVRLMAINPRKRFNIPYGGEYTIWDLGKSGIIDPKSFLSMGKATPFEGREVFGENRLTAVNGKIIYNKETGK